MGSDVGLTLDARLTAGEVVAVGDVSEYRRLQRGPGEGRFLRLDLAAEPPAATGRRSLLHIAHVTDLQLADVQSPGRFEFFEALRGLPGSSSFVPAQRPQETLVARAFEAMLRTIESSTSRETGSPVGLVLATGDNVDNAQWNELSWYLSLLGGGQVAMGGTNPYRGVQAADWPGDLVWRPDGGPDRWRVSYGFPTVPGLLERALAAFDSPGLAIPWISCFGNHDGLPLGVAIPTAEYQAIGLSGEKAFAMRAGFDAMEHEEDLIERPEIFFGGPRLEVPASKERRVVGRREFVEAHMGAPGLPAGHGYSWANVEAGTTYFAYDASPLVRVLALDTANLDGFHEGSIGARQYEWLEEQLCSCHSSCLSPDGSRMRPGGEDRLVVLASHHGSRKLTNLRQSALGLETDHPRLGADAVLRLLGRFPNVVLWLNGHTHVNEVLLHHTPAGGFAEVTTCSIADWPSQARLVELVLNGDGSSISILNAMVNHASPLVPAGAAEGDPAALASLHRELAANVPLAGFGCFVEGMPADRNCEIVLPTPFPVV